MAIYDIDGNVIVDDKKTDILSLNPYLKERLVQAKRPLNNNAADGYLTEVQPLTLLWFTDIHANQTELERIMQVRSTYLTSIDDTICTGDMVRLRYNDGMAWWDEVEDSDEILTVIGNHDMLSGTSGYDYKNQAVPQATLYNTYFHPNIWGCVCESGKTYYYKDYPSKKVRLIALNCMLWDDEQAAQLTWFEGVLSGALTNEYSVLVCMHYAMPNGVQINGYFRTLDHLAPSLASSIPVEYVEAVHDFTESGGEFICYISGHSHFNNFFRNSSYPNQHCIILDAADSFFGNRYGDTQRVEGTRSQDIAAFLVLDTSSKALKMIRIGADIDHYLRPIHCLTFRYLTGDILCDY